MLVVFERGTFTFCIGGIKAVPESNLIGDSSISELF